MSKRKSTAFFCQECGYEAAKWVGRCGGCGAWNTMVEEPATRAAGGKKGLATAFVGRPGPVAIGEVQGEEEARLMAAARLQSWPLLPLLVRCAIVTGLRRGALLEILQHAARPSAFVKLSC